MQEYQHTNNKGERGDEKCHNRVSWLWNEQKYTNVLVVENFRIPLLSLGVDLPPTPLFILGLGLLSDNIIALCVTLTIW